MKLRTRTRVGSWEKFICRADLNRSRAQYVHFLLVSGKGELATFGIGGCANGLRDHETLAKHVDTGFEGDWTMGERLDGLRSRRAPVGSFSSGLPNFWRSGSALLIVFLRLGQRILISHIADLIISCLANPPISSPPDFIIDAHALRLLLSHLFF